MTLQADRSGKPAANDMKDIQELTEVVRELIETMNAGNIGSLKLEYGSLRIALRSSDAGDLQTVVSKEPVQVSVPAQEDGASSEVESGHLVIAPMIGTFYVAPAPNEPPFVTPGDHVQEGQTIGIIEAMKIMNEIAADCTGTIIDVIAGDGQTVEYGSPLVRIAPATE